MSRESLAADLWEELNEPADVLPDDPTLAQLESMSAETFLDIQADALLCARPGPLWIEDAAQIQSCLIRWRETADPEAAFDLISLLSSNVERYLSE